MKDKKCKTEHKNKTGLGSCHSHDQKHHRDHKKHEEHKGEKHHPHKW